LTRDDLVSGDLVHQAAEEYQKLTEGERQEYLREYNEHEDVKEKGEWISNWSKSNDVAQTTRVVGHEVREPRESMITGYLPVQQLQALHLRTGIEAVCHVVRGGSDFTFPPITFRTEGIASFLQQVYNIDEQDFVAKLEGYAVHGLRGKAHLLIQLTRGLIPCPSKGRVRPTQS